MAANPLIHRITQGDREAFDTLCRERYASLVSYAGMFLSTEWAKDAIPQGVMPPGTGTGFLQYLPPSWLRTNALKLLRTQLESVQK